MSALGACALAFRALALTLRERALPTGNTLFCVAYRRTWIQDWLASRIARSSMSDLEPEPTTAQVFERLRETLVDVMGTAAAATFLRRAIRKAAILHPEVGTIAITKKHLDYEYVIPDPWTESREGMPALAHLSGELEELLRELTGPVMVRKLRSVPLLANAGLFGGEEIDHA